MAALRPEHRYGLSCGKNDKNTSNKTLYHVKLTDTAMRALEAYQNLKGFLPNQPVICFKGNQGYIKIPVPSSDPSGAMRVFSFYLSGDNKEQPQASFECIHQYVTGDNQEKLECPGIIQDKITVCATDDSYQATKERMSQVEKDNWSRTAIEIKPGSTPPSKCLKMPVKRPALPSTSGTFNRYSPSNRRGGAWALVANRPLRDRIIHLLALKPYKKPELLLWLDREKASTKDKTDLGSVLEEVAKLNARESFVLKDEFYRHVQRDWPGYLEEEKQLVLRMLARKTQPLNSSQSESFLSNPSLQESTEPSTSYFIPAKYQAVKRPAPPDLLQSPAGKKKPRVSDQAPGPGPLPDSTPAPAATSLHVKDASQKTGDNRLGSQNGNPPPQPSTSSTDVPRTEQRPLQAVPMPPRTEPAVCTDEQLADSQHKKKKAKKQMEKERERLKDDEKGKSARPDLKPNVETHDRQEGAKTPVTPPPPAEVPDYILTYGPITALEQRQKYKADFCAEYDEYRELHSRISSVTEIFVQLSAKIKTLSPGTKEHKVQEAQLPLAQWGQRHRALLQDLFALLCRRLFSLDLMEEQIIDKYNKYKKKFPQYREEKRRCEYLHQKLSHIKSLVVDFDQKQATL
ncbi:hypothetical protein MATL_G00093850 [Megalops atlanticus]|uniref:OCEL domain-containing protein n=1 Tax=Megalops atlanticus TaxID=7932 RepID=A0A9D3Q1M7_MEGAT|nr:hypothetical protein MATL_G00093850 [Megalops atlanticus]